MPGTRGKFIRRSIIRNRTISVPQGRVSLGNLFPGKSIKGGLHLKFSDFDENRFQAFAPKGTSKDEVIEAIDVKLHTEDWAFDGPTHWD